MMWKRENLQTPIFIYLFILVKNFGKMWKPKNMGSVQRAWNIHGHFIISEKNLNAIFTGILLKNTLSVF